MQDIRYDFHIHSNFSDGVLSPSEIVDRYERRGFKFISITDHDNTKGSEKAFKYAINKNIKVIPGIELSTKSTEGYEVHILGYYINYSSEALNSAIKIMDMYRNQRNIRLIKELNNRGYDVTHEEINKLNEGRFIGKPVIARILVKKGYVSSVEEAFRNIFNKIKTDNVKKKVFSTEEAIKLIKDAGGIAVLAHPMELIEKGEDKSIFTERLKFFLNKMLEMDIDGIECFHPSANIEDEKMLREYAAEHKLIITGGSDFHSDNDRRFKYEN